MAFINISYIPATEPNGPEIRCSSSCIIKSVESLFLSFLKQFIASNLHGRDANLSIVPMIKDGDFL